jgi:hypothetical protein
VEWKLNPRAYQLQKGEEVAGALLNREVAGDFSSLSAWVRAITIGDPGRGPADGEHPDNAPKLLCARQCERVR